MYYSVHTVHLADPTVVKVRRLVFEYSFTKERRISEFNDIVRRLQSCGFEVMYEGLSQSLHSNAWMYAIVKDM